MGGNMSFLKDNIMSNLQPKSGMIQSPLNPNAGAGAQPIPNVIMGGNGAQRRMVVGQAMPTGVSVMPNQVGPDGKYVKTASRGRSIPAGQGHGQLDVQMGRVGQGTHEPGSAASTGHKNFQFKDAAVIKAPQHQMMIQGNASTNSPMPRGRGLAAGPAQFMTQGANNSQHQ